MTRSVCGCRVWKGVVPAAMDVTAAYSTGQVLELL